MFLLLLMGLGAAGVKAQVRIGGNGAPQGAAVLDLNADNTATPTANKGALALPRVSLASTTAQLNGATPITGMLVYNTNATLGVGIYFWNGSNWIIISGDGVIGNELTDTIPGGGLDKKGAGTAADPWKVGIRAGGVTTTMIADGTITGADIANQTISGTKLTAPILPPAAAPTGVTSSTITFTAITGTVSLPSMNILDHVQIPWAGMVPGALCNTPQGMGSVLIYAQNSNVHAVCLYPVAAETVIVRCYVPSS